MGETLPFHAGPQGSCADGAGSHHDERRILDIGFPLRPDQLRRDRILFSVDYPYSSAVPAKRWVDSIPVSPGEKRKITHGNADRLLKIYIQ